MVTMTQMQDERCFLVIHPLDDVQEVKCDAGNIGPMPMTPAVKYSLWTLRGYLIAMGLLVLFHVLDIAGVFRHVH